MRNALRKIVFLIAGALASSPAAIADTAGKLTEEPTLATRPVAKSIWQIDDNGDATHLQSQLRCPAVSGAFHRIGLVNYDPYGFDVDCNYVDANRTLITLYLTRRSDGHPIAGDFAEAEGELLTRYPLASAIKDSDRGDGPAGISWVKKLYANPANSMTEGIWIGDLQGWTLEYRATFADSNAQAAIDEMASLTATAISSAGAHLRRCAASDIPPRGAVSSVSREKALGLSVGLGALASGTPYPSGGNLPVELQLKPAEWCAESGFEHDNVPIMLWHALDSSGKTIAVDRASVMTIEEPLAVQAAADPMANIVPDGQTPPSVQNFVISYEQGDELAILDIVSGRPDGDTMGGFIDDLVHGKAKPIARVDRKLNTISIVAPQ